MCQPQRQAQQMIYREVINNTLYGGLCSKQNLKYKENYKRQVQFFSEIREYELPFQAMMITEGFMEGVTFEELFGFHRQLGEDGPPEQGSSMCKGPEALLSHRPYNSRKCVHGVCQGRGGPWDQSCWKAQM